MDSLFDARVYQRVTDRLNKLTSTTPPLWGKMSVSQMLAHCKVAFEVPLSQKPMKRSLPGRLIGWIFKKQLYDDRPWKQNLPTSPAFIIRDKRDFYTEKEALENLVTEFHTKGTGGVGLLQHHMFGAFTKDQWGQAMFKHLDHHLRQFGV